jgi:hypothetical protein
MILILFNDNLEGKWKFSGDGVVVGESREWGKEKRKMFFFFFWNPLEAWRKWEKNGPITKKNLMSQMTKLPLKRNNLITLHYLVTILTP